LDLLGLPNPEEERSSLEQLAELLALSQGQKNANN